VCSNTEGFVVTFVPPHRVERIVPIELIVMPLIKETHNTTPFFGLTDAKSIFIRSISYLYDDEDDEN
jgi:hypothetical protein